jgi:capsule biosynthesis phosphatase
MLAESDNAIVVDVDGTLCGAKPAHMDYDAVEPNLVTIERLRAYREQGFRIVLYTSRNMRTFNGNLGRINAHTAPVLLEWLKRNEIEYDEIYFGKPWCGPAGFYLDDRSVRPSEFIRLEHAEILELIGRE